MADMGGTLVGKGEPLTDVVEFLSWFKQNPYAWAEYLLRLRELFDTNITGVAPEEVIKINSPNCSMIPERFARLLMLAAIVKFPEWEVVFK